MSSVSGQSTHQNANNEPLSESQDEDLQPKVVSNSVVIVRTFTDAEKYGVPVIHALRNEDIRFVLRKTTHPQSHLSDKAKEQLYLDALDLERTWLRRKLDGFRDDEFTSSQSTKTALQYRGKVLADHYQVTTSTVSRILKMGRKKATTNTRPRSGRPTVFTRIHQQHALKKNNELIGCSTRTLEAVLQTDPPVNYVTRYKGNERRSPSDTTLWRLMQREELVIQTVRFRPLLSETNQQERLDWCQERLFRSVRDLNTHDGDTREAFARHLETLVDVDECYLVYSVGTGTLYFLPEDFEKMNQGGTDEYTGVIMDEWKKNPPKILIFGAITAPRLLNPRTSHLEGAKFDETKRGIVQVRRVRAVSKYQRKTKQHQRHDRIPVELTSEYRKKSKSVVSSNSITTTRTVAKHPYRRSPVPIIRVQQDNAGGHGFNNLNGGKPTETQRRLVETMKARGYIVYSQPRNSPEFNMLDLGFWNSIKAAVRQRSHEIQSLPNATHGLIQQKMWEIVKQVVDEYDPAKLFSIAVQKQVLMEECIRLNGGSIVKEPHIGIRQFWGLV